MAEAKARRFYLTDPDTGDRVPGLVGLATRKNNIQVGKDGLIKTDDLTAQEMEELERMAATAGHPVTESEPAGVK